MHVQEYSVTKCRSSGSPPMHVFIKPPSFEYHEGPRPTNPSITDGSTPAGFGSTERPRHLIINGTSRVDHIRLHCAKEQMVDEAVSKGPFC